MSLLVAKIIISAVVLSVSANILIKLAEGFSSRIKISPLIVGTIIVATGTSLPELSVAVSSLIQKTPSLSLGNIIGSSVLNIFLIIGLSILLFPIRIGTEKTQRNNYLLLFLTALFIGLNFVSGEYQHTLVYLLLFFYPVFLIFELVWAKEGSLKEDKKALAKLKKERRRPLLLLGGIAGAIGAILYSSRTLTVSAVEFAAAMKISNEMVGLTLLSIGTTLPEMVTSIVSGFKKDWKILFGNIQGSNIFNLSIIGSLIFLANGLSGDGGNGIHRLSLLYLALAAGLFFFITKRYAGTTVPKLFGFLFLAIYASCLILVF